MKRSNLRRMAGLGVVLATVGALARLIPGWSAHYAHAPWMHIKLTIGLVLGGLHGLLVNRVRKASQGTPVAPGTFVGIAVTYAVLGLAAVALALFRPGE